MAQKMVMLRMRVREGKEQEARELMARHQAATHEEDGNRLYAVCVDADDPRWMVALQIYDDAAAVEAHKNAPTYGRTLGDSDDIFEGGNDAVDMHWLEVLPSASPKGVVRGDR